MGEITPTAGNTKNTGDLPIKQDELAQNLNILSNPYPAGHFCAKLYDIFTKSSPIAANKMYHNIKVNANENIEIGNNEYMTLRVAPNDIDIKERNGKIYFIGDAEVREVKNLGRRLLTSETEMIDFINYFPSSDNALASNMGNMMRIFGVYTPGPNDGFWDGFKKDWNINGQGYVILGRDQDGNRLGAKAYVDNTTKKYKGDLFGETYLDDGYMVIVSRPIQK